MSGPWLKCDNCNKGLSSLAEQEMQLAVRFKPSLFPLSVGQLHPREHRQRCRSCGWVNVFVPVASTVSIERDSNPLLTPSWRRVTVKS